MEDFPIEILLHIFGFIPNKWSLSLACWKFYEIICETEKEKFCLKLIDVSNDNSQRQKLEQFEL